MSKRKGGSRRKSRGELTKSIRLKGKISIRSYLAKYSAGDKVILKLDPTVNEGTFHARFIGKAGTVEKKRGSCYEVKIRDLNKYKSIIVHPIHLKSAK
jgi:large subunit ribosomal protein L21e